MDTGFLLAARLGVDPLAAAPASSPPDDVVSPDLEPAAPASAAWIEGALARVAGHQRSGQTSRVWPIFRVLEPLLPDLGARDPGSAALVLRALATQALVEGSSEAFLDRAHRAADAFDRAGAAGAAAVERASLGAGYRMLGAWDPAERALRAATALEGADAARARIDLGRVLHGRGSAAEAGPLFAESAALFAGLGDAGGEGVARAFRTATLSDADPPASLAEARRAEALLAPFVAGRPLAALALTQALLAAGDVAAARAAAEDGLCAPGELAEGEVARWLALGDARRASADLSAAALAFGEARRRVLADASKLRDPGLRRAFLDAPDHRRAIAGS